MTAVVKRDKLSGLDRNDRQKRSHLQRTLLIRKGSIKYCLLLLWARLKISYGAFTPDANEALSVSDLHVKSMQRRDRHPAA